MACRERNRPVLVYLNDDELRILDMRCEEHDRNRSQIIRELIVMGFNYSVDYKNLKDVCRELSAIGRNLNQIAARINATGSVYEADMNDIKGQMEKTWQSLRSILSKETSLRRSNT